MAVSPIQTQAVINATGTGLKPDAYYDKMLLKMLRQLDFQYAKFADEKMLPQNYGDTINWRRFVKLSPTQTPLTEGATPTGKSVSGSSLTAVIHQYGDVLYFSDLVDVQQLDDVKREYTIELGYLAKETLDLIVRNVLASEGSAYFAGANDSLDDLAAYSAGTNDDRPKVDDFRKISIVMKKAFLKGNRKANGRYVALVSPEVMYELFDDQRMQDFMQFGQSNAPFGDGMVVDLFGIRWIEVLNAPVVSNASVACHDSIVIAEEAYAITQLEGAGVQIITKGLGSAGVEDPLNQRQSIGWKINGFGAKVLNNEAVVNYWSVPSTGTLSAASTQDPLIVTFALRTTNANVTIIDSTVEAIPGETYSTLLARAIALGLIKVASGTTAHIYDAAANGNELTTGKIYAAATVYITAA